MNFTTTVVELKQFLQSIPSVRFCCVDGISLHLYDYIGGAKSVMLCAVIDAHALENQTFELSPL